jgi:hypothetical protein
LRHQTRATTGPTCSMAAPPPPPSTPLPPYNGAPSPPPTHISLFALSLPSSVVVGLVVLALSRLLSFGQWGRARLGGGVAAWELALASEVAALRRNPAAYAQLLETERKPLYRVPPPPSFACVASLCNALRGPRLTRAAVGRARTWSSRHRGARTTSSSKPAKVARSP